MTPNSNQHTEQSEPGFPIPLSSKRNQGSPEKELLPGMKRGKYQVSLEHSRMPEGKEIFFLIRNMLRRHRNQPERIPSDQN